LRRSVPAPTAPAQAAAADDEHDVENARKRQIEEEQSSILHGPAKRPRLSNGYENGADATPKSPMDVDDEQNGDGNAYPSPEQLPSPIIATNGPEKGTQVDKVSELIAETTFLDLSEDSSSSRNTILLQCEYNPRDPMVLAAAGTDALARMWTFSRATAESDVHNHHISPPHHNLLGDGLPSSTIATGLAWSSDGYSIAIASEPLEGDSARVEVWNSDGTSIACFESFESPVIQLRWNFSNNLLLALSPEGNGAVVTIMVPTSQESLHHSLPGHNLMDQLLEVTWTNNEEFVLCGGDTLIAFSCSEGIISPVRKYETHEGQVLSKVTFDWPSRLLATATDLGMIYVCLNLPFHKFG
jgi:transducin (beta)-like 1